MTRRRILERIAHGRGPSKPTFLGLALLRERAVQLFSAVDGQNLTEETDEMTEGMVTIMAVFAQIEKSIHVVGSCRTPRLPRRSRDR